MVIIFYNLANVFINKVGTSQTLNKLGLLQDFIVGLVITVYLIYIIPEEFKTLQTIITAVVAAVYGGLLTLTGVAWTIKQSIVVRHDNMRLENVPYLCKKIIDRTKNVPIITGVVESTSFNEYAKNNAIKGNKKLCVLNTVSFQVRRNDCISCGLIFNGMFFAFDIEKYLDKGNCLRIISDNFYADNQNNPQAFIVLRDIFENYYKYQLLFQINLATKEEEVKGIGQPILLTKEEKFQYSLGINAI